jgi:hypothetical protein
MYRFEVKGNPENPGGNPLPKLHTTRRQFWLEKSKRYTAWKDYVVGSLFKALGDSEEAKPLALNLAVKGKPLDIGDGKASMKILIHFGNRHHGDPENIFGSIADALFVNDKHLVGSFDYVYSTGQGRVEIEISLLGNAYA